jgi:hypothetical protein
LKGFRYSHTKFLPDLGKHRVGGSIEKKLATLMKGGNLIARTR